jgi:hypothetical protein
MRDSLRVRMSDVCSVMMSNASHVSRLPRRLGATALTNDRYSQKSSYSSQQIEVFPHSVVAQDVASFKEPDSRFSRRSKSVLVKTRAIRNGAPRIGFLVVGCDGAERSSQLIGDVPRTRIGCQFLQVRPGTVRREESQTVGRRVPQCITCYFDGQRLKPSRELVIDRHAELSPALSSRTSPFSFALTLKNASRTPRVQNELRTTNHSSLHCTRHLSSLTTNHA